MLRDTCNGFVPDFLPFEDDEDVDEIMAEMEEVEMDDDPNLDDEDTKDDEDIVSTRKKRPTKN